MTQSKKRSTVNPLYFISEACAGMWRHRMMSIASILVLASCLILLGAFALLIVNLNVNLDKLGLLNEIVVFADYDIEQSEVDDIGEDIKALDNVESVTYVSKASGLDSMRETYPDYEEIFDDIESGGDNPLADSFIITYKDTERVYELEAALHAIPGVNKVNNRLDYAVKVANFRKGVSVVFVWFFALLFIVSLFVIFNTIRLAVHGRKNEINIMRYIGATKRFIVTPFVIEGSIIGLASGLIAYFADAGIYRKLLTFSEGELQMLEFIPFSGFSAAMLVSFLAIGILSGVFTSIFSLRKNLNN